MTLQEQALAILAPVPSASLLDSPHARELAASQLVPALMTLILHAKDIGSKAVLPDGVHELVSDMAHVCVQINAGQWSTDDQRDARVKAEALIGSWMRPTARVVVTGLRGKVIGMVTPEPLAACIYCGRENPDAAASDYCSRSCAIAALGEGA